MKMTRTFETFRVSRRRTTGSYTDNNFILYHQVQPDDVWNYLITLKVVMAK